MLLSILLPGIAFIMRGKMFKGIISIFLQLSFVGWLPAAIWCIADRNDAKNEKRHQEMMAFQDNSNS